MIRGLPYDAELEYLESTGTQYIDSNVEASVDVDVVLNVGVPSNAYNALFGAWAASSNSIRYSLNVGSGNNLFYCTINASNVTTGLPTSPFMVSRIGNSVIVGSVQRTLSDVQSASWGGRTLWIFGVNRGSTVNLSANGTRVYACKIYINSVLVRDLIPVRVGSGASAVGYMYDRVSRRLFGNAGSGAFVLGPDKAVPILSLHRYPSPSNGVALGKMGVGANLVFNEEDYIMTTQLTITENCTDMATATTHIQALLNASGIDADAIGFIKLHSDSPRNNALLASSFMMRTMPSGVQARLRFRGGVIQLVNSSSEYDADVQVGDVYDVYVMKNTEGWEQ